MNNRIVLLALAAIPAAMAQEDVVRIENWRVHEGDDMRWAAPDFDDSRWEPSSWPRRQTTGQRFFTGTRWYRATVSIPPNIGGRPLAIALDLLDEVYDVFVNGVRIGTHGDWEPTPTGKFPALLSFPIPEPAPRGPVAYVAIRRWTGPTRTNFSSFAELGHLFAPHAPEIGPADVIRLGQELRKAASSHLKIANMVVPLLMLLAGLLSLALYFAQQASRENQWLGLALICESAAPLLGLAVLSSGLPIRSPIAAAAVGLQFSAFAFWPQFLASICPRLVTPLGWAVVVNGLIAVAVAMSYGAYWPLPYSVQLSVAWISMITTVATAAALLIERCGLQTTLLAAAVMLPPAAHFWQTQLSFWLGVAESGRYIHAGPLVIDPRNLARLVFAMTALTILYLRHRREQERQSGLDRDLAAARLVQESLLAGRKASVPGFTVEAAYLPASEVGGDFYQELAGPDGSLLVLVGDVSGKGMRAALLVGHISGALSNERSRRPAEVLANLNESLVGRVSGGFVTCCCARFDADGTVTVANAGHPAPYAGGCEVEVEAGLPLGVVGGVEYAESRLVLGGQFVLVSDGVVEAENPKRELFGFDRTREISDKPAQQIAEAARAWGQNDDITVVTVRRTA